MITRGKKSRKVSKKGQETLMSKCGRLGLTGWADFKEIVCDLYLELPLFNTTKRTKGRN